MGTLTGLASAEHDPHMPTVAASEQHYPDQTVCMNCVAQGGPFVVGALVYLRVMGTRVSRRRQRAEPTPTESAGEAHAAGLPEPWDQDGQRFETAAATVTRSAGPNGATQDPVLVRL